MVDALELGGSFQHEPEEASSVLSEGAKALIREAYEGIPNDAPHDYHVHVLGMDTNGSGTWVNPRFTDPWSPIGSLHRSVYLSGAAVTDMEHMDRQFLLRLVRLARAIPGWPKLHLLAFDHHYEKNGEIDFEKSEFYVPNEYVWELSETYPDLFVPVVSVHPYRPDALHELATWADMGVKMVKWLPNAHGIDASDAAIDPYYAIMKRHDMVLLTHVGEEKAVKVKEDQILGNPLRFRRPLDLGVRVVMAHCGSLGKNVDFDDPELREVRSYELFLRMMDHPCYDGLLYGEISAMTQANRIPDALIAILERPDLHHRLINGSDYPLPAINVVIRTGKLVDEGLITEDERALLNEIYDVNPLVFDFVVKRTIRLRDESGEVIGALDPVMFGPLRLTAPGVRNPDCRRDHRLPL